MILIYGKLDDSRKAKSADVASHVRNGGLAIDKNEEVSISENSVVIVDDSKLLIFSGNKIMRLDSGNLHVVGEHFSEINCFLVGKNNIYGLGEIEVIIFNKLSETYSVLDCADVITKSELIDGNVFIHLMDKPVVKLEDK